MSEIKLILTGTGAWLCHVPFFNQQEREETLWRNEESSQKRNFVQDTRHSANFVKMLEGSEI